MTVWGDQDYTIIGDSAPLRRALALTDQFASTTLSILLVGATGTGKELFAHRIHVMSRRAGPFVVVNCAALPREMIESLLFGHAKGAFTGAIGHHRGYLEIAHGGTLFLDELPSLSPEAQAKFLRAVETRTIERLGETTGRRTDFRIVAAADDDLHHRLETGAFRHDFHHRLAQVMIRLPLLAERSTDIGLLAHHFASLAGKELNADALTALSRRSWPGNVRELRAVIERAACLDGQGIIGASEVAQAFALGSPEPPRLASSQPSSDERRQLLKLSSACGGNAGRMAVTLGVSRATLFRRLRAADVSLRKRVESQSLTESRETG